MQARTQIPNLKMTNLCLQKDYEKFGHELFHFIKQFTDTLYVMFEIYQFIYAKKYYIATSNHIR